MLKRNAAAIGLSYDEVDSLLNALCQNAECFELDAPHFPRLSDPDDEPLLRLAECSGARLIATHNLAHLRAATAHGVLILPPRDFLRMLQAKP